MRNVDLGPLLARGRTSDIYAWGNDRVLKVFHAWFPAADVEYEARIARAVQSTGLRVPEVGNVVEVDDRLAIEFERVEGISMGEALMRKPWALGKHTRLLVDLHARIHRIVDPGGIPLLKDRLQRRISNLSEISDDVRARLLEALESLPNGNRLCHGDFHPGNVLLTESGPVVIDWIDAAIGSPLADVARTSILALGELNVQNHLTPRDRILWAWGHRMYKRGYLGRNSAGEEEYASWRPIVAAARLSEGIEYLAPWLKSRAETVVAGAAHRPAPTG